MDPTQNTSNSDPALVLILGEIKGQYYVIEWQDAAPIIDASLTDLYDTALVKLDVSVFTVSGVNVSKWTISWGDEAENADPETYVKNGFTSTFLHYYTKPGTYNITLKVTGENNEWSDKTYVICAHQVGKQSVELDNQESETVSKDLPAAEIFVNDLPVAAPEITINAGIKAEAGLENNLALLLEAQKEVSNEILDSDLNVNVSNAVIPDVYDLAVALVTSETENNADIMENWNILDLENSKKSTGSQSKTDLSDIFADEIFQNELDQNF